MFFCFCFVLFDYPNMHLTEGSSFTRRVRDAGHASRRRERTQRMEEEGVVPSRRRGDRGRRANVEPQPEPEHEQEHDDMDVQQQQMEEEEFQEELEAMDEDMEDEQPQRRQTKKKHVVDPEPLHDYPSGPHDTSLLWRYHAHLPRKASDGEVFINVKLTLIWEARMSGHPIGRIGIHTRCFLYHCLVWAHQTTTKIIRICWI
jgi:hypothetical protein